MDCDTAAIVAGAALQVLGVGIAVWKGWAIVSGWLKSIRDRALGPKPTIGTAVGIAEGKDEAHFYAEVDIDGTIDDQLKALKGQLRELTKTVVTQDQQMRTLAKDEKDFEQQRSEREQLDQQLRKLVRANAPWAVVGAILVILGIVLSTIGALR